MASNRNGNNDRSALNLDSLIADMKANGKTASQYRMERIILALTDCALLLIAMAILYLAGVGSLPWLAAPLICIALALTSYCNHNHYS